MILFIFTPFCAYFEFICCVLFCLTIMDCFYLKNLPDMKNKLLYARIFHVLGFCKIDIFRPNFGRQFNYGSCKIFMSHELAMKLDWFKLVPHEWITFNLGFEYPVIISRWVKNVVETNDNDKLNYVVQNEGSLPIDVNYENEFKCDESVEDYDVKNCNFINDLKICSVDFTNICPDDLSSKPGFKICNDVAVHNCHSEKICTSSECLVSEDINTHNYLESPFQCLASNAKLADEIERHVPFVLARTFGDPPTLIYYDYYIYLDLLCRLYLKFGTLMKNEKKLLRGMIVKHVIKAKLVNFQTFKDLAHDRHHDFKD